jgi:hypothetical protein
VTAGDSYDIKSGLSFGGQFAIQKGTGTFPTITDFAFTARISMPECTMVRCYGADGLNSYDGYKELLGCNLAVARTQPNQGEISVFASSFLSLVLLGGQKMVFYGDSEVRSGSAPAIQARNASSLAIADGVSLGITCTGTASNGAINLGAFGGTTFGELSIGVGSKIYGTQSAPAASSLLVKGEKGSAIQYDSGATLANTVYMTGGGTYDIGTTGTAATKATIDAAPYSGAWVLPGYLSVVKSTYVAPPVGAAVGAKTIAYIAEYSIGTTTGAYTVDFAANGAHQTVTPTGIMNLTLTPVASAPAHYQLKVTSGGTAYSHTWVTTVKWLTASPTFTNSKATIVSLYYDGATWYGSSGTEV